MISPLNRKTGCRTLVLPLPTDPTRGFDCPPEIPQFLSSISSLSFIGFIWTTAELIWKLYVQICTKLLRFPWLLTPFSPPPAKEQN